jgi:hypothetical protein
MLALFLLSTATFLAAHAGVAHATGASFRDNFRLARGLAALLLSVIGFFTLVRWYDFAGSSYTLLTPDPLADKLLMVPFGHFAADFLLLTWGWFTVRERPRRDLIFHHLVGVAAGVATVRYAVATPLYLLLLTTEIMPVTTGISAYGAWAGHPRIERTGAWARLAVLVIWRLPFWSWVGGSTFLHWLYNEGAPDALAAYILAATFSTMTLSLDVYWTYKSWEAVNRPAR